ncbi:uncharacterized protein BO95DRAFT_234743 [Aspergillus brunneoviolaceus CBS 621.78]|uniref:Uncharacterized protein n=1 Tax=Aspergillus brunneoviolaceus CBS 621.78 TaxID=1450534 RepID=A0ACD1FZV5_9EURO|nr:hypothetical protein BO95DRAFT_234743 [Aspergillus brunneoviolaceus CBS 621.78]RAH42537.1 hypothetical protein BO95DRAFT_234743 [Aspergillus brunneoviolaceus CBS 621.78]
MTRPLSAKEEHGLRFRKLCNRCPCSKSQEYPWWLMTRHELYHATNGARRSSHNLLVSVGLFGPGPFFVTL